MEVREVQVNGNQPFYKCDRYGNKLDDNPLTLSNQSIQECDNEVYFYDESNHNFTINAGVGKLDINIKHHEHLPNTQTYDDNEANIQNILTKVYCDEAIFSNEERDIVCILSKEEVQYSKECDIHSRAIGA